MLKTTCPVLANSADPDQLASEEANRSGSALFSADPDQLVSEEANRSGSALFVGKYVNFYQKPGSSNLIGWELKVGVASYLFVLRFYGPVNPMWSCRDWSVYLTTHLLGRLSPLSG